jgi:hypothetical protein
LVGDDDVGVEDEGTESKEDESRDNGNSEGSFLTLRTSESLKEAVLLWRLWLPIANLDRFEELVAVEYEESTESRRTTGYGVKRAEANEAESDVVVGDLLGICLW